VASMGKRVNTEFLLVNVKKRVLCRCKDKIKIDVKEIELEGWALD
jgi:hypothetical protein